MASQTFTNHAAFMDSPKSHPFAIRPAPLPDLKPTSILVRASVWAINPVDAKQQFDAILPLSYPLTLGLDFAGTIVAVGPAVTHLKVGDRIASHTPKFGAFQSYIAVDAALSIPLPDNVSFADGASLPVAATTALFTLFRPDYLNLRLPDFPLARPAGSEGALLIWGGSTSVGVLAIQIAVHAGLRVVASSSPRNFALLRRLGASAVLDRNLPEADARSEASRLLLEAADGDASRVRGALNAAGGMAGETCAHALLGTKGGRAFVATLTKEEVLDVPEGAEVVFAGSNLEGQELGVRGYEYVARALGEGMLRVGVRAVVVDAKGLEGVQEGVDLCRGGEVSAGKVVVLA